MSMFGRLRNNVCAAAVLTGILVPSLKASDEFPEELSKTQRMKYGVQGEDNILGYLPDEILLHVLSFTRLQDWGGVSLTCTRFRAIGADAFKDLQAFKQRFQETEKKPEREMQGES